MSYTDIFLYQMFSTTLVTVSEMFHTADGKYQTRSIPAFPPQFELI